MVLLVKQLLVLGLSLAAVAVVSAFVADSQLGPAAYRAAVVAAACVWMSGGLALVCLAVPQPPTRRVASLLMAMLLRMSLPIGLGVVLGTGDGPLAEGGLFGQIVVLYLAALAVETPLALKFIPQTADTQATGPVSPTR